MPAEFQSLFPVVFSQMADGLLVLDEEGIILLANPAAARLLGREAETLTGSHFGHPITWDGPYQMQVLRKGGELRQVELKATVATLGQQEVKVLSLRDITQHEQQKAELVQAHEALRERERQMIEVQRLESVGRLAGGIAHDFNNLMTVILGCGKLLEQGLDAQSPLREDAEEIIKAGERAATLTRQMLAFSRKQMLQPRALDLNRVVRDMERLLRRALGEGIDLRLDLAPGLDPVMADPAQVEQVLLNLLMNARDAMPAGGTVTIQTRNPSAEDGRLSPEEREDFVCLMVGDTGEGMSDEVQARAFEPFFSTKEVGQGTGLGLASVYGIVKQHGGQIRIESAPERGTRFEILLPRAKPES